MNFIVKKALCGLCLIKLFTHDGERISSGFSGMRLITIYTFQQKTKQLFLHIHAATYLSTTTVYY